MLDERNTLADTFAPSLPPPKPPSGPEVGFVESYEAGLESQRALRNLAVIDAGVSRAYQDRINRVKEATGVELRNPNLVPFYERMFRDDPHSHFRRELHKLAEQHPDKRDIIMPDIPPDAAMLERARAADRADQNLAQRPGTVAGAIGGFVGAARGMIEDPLNAAAMLVGPWGHVGLGVKAMLWAAVKNGAANAAVEAGQAPFVQGWRKKAGLDYGVSHAALDIGGAFAAGFALDIGIRGAYRGARRATGSTPLLDESGGVVRWGSQDAALDHAARTAAKSSRVRQAADGDLDSLHMVAKQAGITDDPAYRGARQAARIEDELGHANAPDGVPEGDHYNAVIAALEAERFGDPIPPAPHVVPAARGHVLSDGSAPPAQAFQKDGKPVTFESIDPATLKADPATFQFRGAVDARGVTGRMSGIETWDQMASGKVVVFERENGERVIADGHHRLELARRLKDQDPQLDGYVFRERDGWTPEDVAAYAAKKNMMDSPRVDPVDAARVLRARPDLVDSSLPLRDGTVQLARHLARLSDEAFDMVVGGVVEPGHAALVGQTVRDHELHAGILTEMARNEPRTLQEARLLLSELTIAPSTVDEQMTLFGLQSFMRPLMRERVAVLDRALRTLSVDRRVFGLLGRESGRIEQAGNLLADRVNAARAAEAATVQEVIERLATQPGPINDWLNDAARAVAAGEKPKHMGEALARRVSATLEKDGLAALMHHAEPQPARIDDPAGPEAKAQVEQMRRDLAQEIKDAKDPEAAAERQARIAELEQGVLLQLQRRYDDVVDAPNFGLPEPPRTLSDADPLLRPRDGDQTPERRAMREALIDQRFAGHTPAPQDQRPIAYLMGGGGASGKGTVLKALRETGALDASFVELDPDSFKTGDKGRGWGGIPEYWEIDARGDSRGAGVVHEESSLIYKAAQARGMAGRYNLVLDQTLGNLGKAEALIKSLKAAGYEVRLVGVTVDIATAINRAVARAKGAERRYVPLDHLIDAHRGFSLGFARYAELVDHARLLDTGGKMPQTIASKQIDSPLHVVSEALYDEFIRKADLNAKATTLRDLQGASEHRRPPRGPRQTDAGAVAEGARGAPEGHDPERPPHSASISDQRLAQRSLGSDIHPTTMHRTLAAADKWEEIGKALRDTLRMLPRDVKLRVEERLDVFGGAADGFWHPGERLIYVAMTGTDPVRTARHETIHALRGSGLMTDAEFDTLYRFAEANGLRKTYGVDLTWKELYTAKYGDQGEAHIEALLREETVAEMFADYSLNGKRFGSYDGGGVVDGIVDRIVKWMKGLRDALHDLGFKNVRDVFEEIESGRMAMRREIDRLGAALRAGDRAGDLGEWPQGTVTATERRGADDAGFGAAMGDGARLGDLGDAAEACRA